MPLLRLHLLRHGQTNASRGNLFCGRRLDPALTDEGREMAASFAAAYRARRWAAIYSSPLGRAVTTAQPLADAIGLPIETRDGFAEIDYGAWDGLTAEQCLARDPAVRAAWLADPFATRCPGGESGADVAARALPIVRELAAWTAADRSRSAIVMAHNHVNRIVLTDLLGWPMADYRRRLNQDPAGYNLITFGGDGPVVRRINAPAAPGVGGE